jgi:Protein of unknown function (DUF444)
VTTSSEQPPPSRLALLSLGTGLFRQYRPSDTDQVSKPGSLEIGNHARIGPIPRVISLEGLQIPIQVHRQSNLTHRPCASANTPAQPVHLTPSAHGRFTFAGYIGRAFQIDAFALVERREYFSLVSQFFAYLEAGEANGSNFEMPDSSLWTLYQRLRADGAPLSMRKVSDRSEIFPVFHDLFQRRQKEKAAP